MATWRVEIEVETENDGVQKKAISARMDCCEKKNEGWRVGHVARGGGTETRIPDVTRKFCGEELEKDLEERSSCRGSDQDAVSRIEDAWLQAKLNSRPARWPATWQGGV